MHKNPWGAILRGPIAFALSLSLIEVMLFSTPLEAQRSAYVTNINSNTVSVIDTLTDTVTATIAVGTQPAGVVVTPDGAHVYVANFVDNTVSVIATATNTVVATVPAGTAPFAIAITPDGARVYVGNAGSGTVSVIATATNTVVAPVVVGGEPRGVAITPDGTRAYIANDVSNSVSVINTATNTVVATVPAGTAPFAVAITPDGTRAYVANDFSNNVSVIDTATNTVVATVPVGSRPFGVAITPDGARAYVTNRDAGTASLIATATNTVVGTIYAGAIPFGIAITPDGAHAYVTNMAINTVSVIATATNAVVATVRVGTPFGVAITPSAATPSDPTPPVITPNVSGTLGLNGWYTSSVNLTWSVSDPESGISSTQNCGPREFTDESGLIVRCIATNGAGLSNRVEVTIKIDRDPPVISGMPPAGCALGPPDDRLVTVATVFGFDIRSGVASFDLTVTSNEPSDPADIIITKSGDQARTLQLRLKRDRTYTIAATETDSAGNPVRATTTCTVPRKRGAAPPSTFTKIDFPGAIKTQLYSINNRGQIVGAYSQDGVGWHGLLLDNGTFTYLPGYSYGHQQRGPDRW